MSQGAKPPEFSRKTSFDQDELLGASWWQVRRKTSTVANAAPRPDAYEGSRRQALHILLALGGFAAVAALVGSRRKPRFETVQVAALDAQRARGLATGADVKQFEWPDAVDTDCDEVPFDRNALTTLATALIPEHAEDRAIYLPTLFACLKGEGGEAFRSVFRLVHSPAMADAYERGRGLRGQLDAADRLEECLLILDLPGPESLSFAAGLRPRAAPICCFGNWPHPLGVVPSHLTMSAAQYWRPRLVAPTEPGPRAACLVLDRNRLRPYAGEASRFDNRYAVTLPPVPWLRRRGIARVLYVVPVGIAADAQPDLEESLAAWAEAGIDVRMFGLDDLRPGPDEHRPEFGNPRYYTWLGLPRSSTGLWHSLAWPSRAMPSTPPATRAFGQDWRPRTPKSTFDTHGLGRLSEKRALEDGGGSGSRGYYGGGS